jgi:hypothetical protein
VAARPRPWVSLLAIGLLPALLAAGCGDSLGDTRDVPVTIPWRGVGTETAEYTIKGPDGTEAGRGTLTIDERGAQTSFRQHYENAEGSDDVEVLADAATLRPQRMTRTVRTNTLVRDVTAEYGTDQVRVVITGEDATEEEIEFPAHAYDTEESLFLWRTLPFQVGYEVKYVSVNPNRPTARVATARVIAQETVTVPAGTFETWVVEVSAAGSALVAWFDSQGTHRLVKYDAGDFLYELLPAP